MHLGLIFSFTNIEKEDLQFGCSLSVVLSKTRVKAEAVRKVKKTHKNEQTGGIVVADETGRLRFVISV